MKLINKIYINPITYTIILLCLLCGLIKYLLIIATILLIHELGHITFMNIFKRKIASINLLPVGCLIKVDAPISSDIFEDIFISVSGILFQIILGIIIYLLNHYGLINSKSYIMIDYYNKIIILFNLVPITPLDGYKIFKLFLESILPYRITFNIAIAISVIILFNTLFINFNLIKDNLLIYMFLIYMVLYEYKNKKFLINRFYLERVLRNFNFKKVSVIKNEKYMYKNRKHIIDGLDEKMYLKNKFKNFKMGKL